MFISGINKDITSIVNRIDGSNKNYFQSNKSIFRSFKIKLVL